jgi:acyl-coenzyme A thioesterase PaaI-like protein
MKKLFPTNLSESARTRWMRRIFNLWPCIWCTGSRVTFIAGNWCELHVELSLNWRTRNRVGTVYGGSIYSSIDPYYMLMFMEILGKDYIVWDKAASIQFVRPITEKVKCRFLITDNMVEQVKEEVDEKGEHTFTFPLKFEDDLGNVYALFSKSIYVATKNFYKEKMSMRKK